MEWSLSQNKLLAFHRLMRTDKPIGALLLLWPTLWALWVASPGVPPLWILAVFVAGVWLMRAAGCVVNDYADRKFDGHVKRTARRPLPSGDVTEKEARTLFIVLVLLSFLLVLTLNTMTILLSVAALALAWVYPFMKRYTHLPQVVLGAAFGWSIPMAFSAVSESLPLSCWLMFLANILWAVAYDTQYAMVDRDDDVKIGIKSNGDPVWRKRSSDYRYPAGGRTGADGRGGLAEWAGLGILLVAVRGGGSVWLAAEAYLQSRPR